MEHDDALDALGRRADDVAEREDARIVDEHVDGDAGRTQPVVELLRRLGAGQVAGDDAHLGGVERPELGAHALELAQVVAHQHEPVAQPGEPQREAAPDARTGPGDQRPGAALGYLSPFHGSLASSSTILRGRLSQCLQHFMSTEYIRAMQ